MTGRAVKTQHFLQLIKNDRNISLRVLANAFFRAQEGKTVVLSVAGVKIIFTKGDVIWHGEDVIVKKIKS